MKMLFMHFEKKKIISHISVRYILNLDRIETKYQMCHTSIDPIPILALLSMLSIFESIYPPLMALHSSLLNVANIVCIKVNIQMFFKFFFFPNHFSEISKKQFSFSGS